MASTAPASSVPSSEKRREARFALFRRTAPGRHDHDHRRAVRAGDESNLHRQFCRARRPQCRRSLEDGSGLGEGINEHAGADARHFVQTVMHGGDDAEVSAAAAQRPIQLLLTVVAGDDDAPIGEHDLCGEEIVERQAEAADQRP